jgi:hypothetical protein
MKHGGLFSLFTHDFTLADCLLDGLANHVDSVVETTLKLNNDPSRWGKYLAEVHVVAGGTGVRVISEASMDGFFEAAKEVARKVLWTCDN